MDYILFTVCIQLVAAGGFLLYPLLLTAALPAMASAAKYRTTGFSQCQYKDGVVSADYNNKHFSSDAASPQEGEA